MSRTSRIVSGAVLAAIAGAALAVPAVAGTASVSFSGSSPLGLAVLACASNPSRNSISMTTDDTLNVENVTGHTAYVYINGSKTTHQVGNNEGVPITFPAGQWSVALAPTCLLNLSDAGNVSVDVTAPAQVTAPAATPTPTAAPKPTHTTAPKPKPPTHTATGQPRSAGTPTPTQTPTPSHPAASPASSPVTSASASTPGIAGGATGTGSSGSGAAGTSTSTHTSTGTTKSTAGSVAAGQDVNIGVAQALPASDSSPATPSYLLVVIALISILGVGSAVIRALNNQRQARRAAY